MKAAVYYGRAGIRVEEHPVPSVPPGMALVKVKASGVCGGEYNIYRKRKEAGTYERGIILGHEVVGEVTEPAGQLKKGMLAAISPNSGCGSCWYCMHGMPYECKDKPDRTALTGGGYAEYSVVSPQQCYPLLPETDPVELAMAEPLACCIHSMDRLQIKMGDRVAILGAGGGAQLFIQLAHLNGASEVTVYDDIQDRLELALRMGADKVVSGYPDTVARSGTDMGDYDAVIVTRSAPVFFEMAALMCGWRGKVLCYGVASQDCGFTASPHLIWKKQLSFIGSRSFEGDAFETAVRLLEAKKLNVKPLINRVITLDQVAEALEHPNGQIKTVIVPGDGQEA